MGVSKSPVTESSGGVSRTSTSSTSSGTATSITSTSTSELTATAVALVSGLIPLDFYVTPSASTTATMLRAGVATAAPASMPFRGSIVGISYGSASTLSAGALTFTALIDGSTTAATLGWSLSTSTGQTQFTKGTYGFDRGSYLALQYTADSSYSGAAVVGTLWVYVDQTEVL